MDINYTSMEQSKLLLKLGLNPNTADMRYEYNNMIGDYEPIPKIGALVMMSLQQFLVGVLAD